MPVANAKNIKAPKASALPASCNVLALGTDQQQFWRFAAGKGDLNLADVQSGAAEDPMPAKHVEKTFSDLWSRRLNVVLLPPDRVFYRVLQMPHCERGELIAMVELQIDKLSPLPLAQTVWTMDVVPARGMLPPETQTVVVTIAERKMVEGLLGRLEVKGYVADNIEVAALRQALAAPADVDGVWLYPEALGEKISCLVAWWCDGVLRNLTQITLASASHLNELAEHITCSTWAGEMAGWLVRPPAWHLVAEGELAANWGQMIGEWLGEPIEVVAPLPASNMAAVTARHAGRARPSEPTLLPAEISGRYRRDFMDSIWLRTLGVGLVVYLLLLVAFVVVSEVTKSKQAALIKELVPLGRESTNAVQLNGQIVQLQEQVALRNAALDAYNSVSEKLPAELSLDQFTFSKGEKIVLRGTAPAAQSDKIEEYTEVLKTATNSVGQILFQKVYPANFNRIQGGAALQWSFTCDFRRKEDEP